MDITTGRDKQYLTIKRYSSILTTVGSWRLYEKLRISLIAQRRL